MEVHLVDCSGGIIEQISASEGRRADPRLTGFQLILEPEIDLNVWAVGSIDI